MTDSFGNFFVALFIIGSFLIYFIPTFCATGKKHIDGIMILNLLLGWTFIGWVIALVWAVSDEKNPNAQPFIRVEIPGKKN